MHNKDLTISKVETMFKDFRKQAEKIINESINYDNASKRIVEIVSSETGIRSKTLFTDMYAEMSKDTLKSEDFKDPERQFEFYEANIRGEVISTFQFSAVSKTGGIDFKEANKLHYSIAAGTGTAVAGGVARYALGSVFIIPVSAIIASSLAVFFLTYKKTVPEKNDAAFKKAVEKFLEDTMNALIQWFDKVEEYYNKRVADLVSTF